MTHKRKVFLCIMLSIIFLLSGCSLVTGAGLFGEVHYSEKETQEIWEKVRLQLQEIDFSEYAYSLEIRKDYAKNYYFYWTDAYVVAYAEGVGDYLWYEDYLYACVEEQMYYRKMPWEELGWKELLDESENFILQLLDEVGELSYKKVPMAGENAYLLTVDYPLTAMVLEEREVYPTLRVWVDEEVNITSVIVTWNDPGIKKEDGFYEGGDIVQLVFEPYENSIDYQAERKVWFFAHDYGLVEEVVPSLNTQEEDRVYCEGMIGKMDFATARETWQQNEELHFPDFKLKEE